MQLRRSFLAKNLLILVVGEAVSRLVYAYAFIHLARVLSPTEYGQIELTLAVILLLTVLIDMGLGVIGTREIARQTVRVDWMVSQVVGMRTFVAGLVCIGMLLFLAIVSLDATLEYLLMGFTLTLLAYPLVLYWVFQGWNKMAWVTVPQVLRQMTFAVLVLVLIQNPAKLHWLPWIEGAAVVLLAVLNALLYLRTGGRPVIDLRHGWNKQLVTTSIPIGMSQMIWALRMYFPVIFLGVISGQEAVGYFGPPHRIVMVLLALLAVYFLNIFPSMSQASFNSTEDLRKLLNSSIRFVLWPSIFMAGMVAVFAQPMVGLVFGEIYARSITVQILAILIWMVPVMAIRGHTRNALISMNYQNEELYCSVFGFAILIVGFLLLAPVMSGAGAAWAMVLSEIIALILTWWRVKTHLPEIRFSEYLFRLPSLAVFSERAGKL